MQATGSDFLQLDPRAAPAGGLTAWLAGEIRDAITDGRLGPGAPMPSTRQLAHELGVSRGVVVEAFQRLTDEGLLGARQGSGTRVLRPPARRTAAHPSSAPRRAPALVDLAPDAPDLEAFPRSSWLRAERRAIGRHGALDDADPRGTRRLREAVAGWLNHQRGMAVHADEVVVTAGVTQAAALLGHVLADRGLGEIGVEDPGRHPAVEALAAGGLRPVPVRVDAHGLRVDDLATSGVRAVLTTPAHQFPTGAVLSTERRHALLAWAGSGGLVIEDDCGAEIRHERAPVRPLQPDAPDRVAYASSVARTLAPGLRLGWLVPPPRLLDAVVDAQRASGSGTAALTQLTLAELLVDGSYGRHVRRLRHRLRARRDALLTALGQRLPAARVDGIAAGQHLMLTFPSAPYLDDTVLAARLAAAGLLVRPLSRHRRLPGPPGLVLGYAAHPPERLQAVAATIAATAHELL